MATLYKEKGKKRDTWVVQFVDRDNQRQKIRVSGITKRVAASMRVKIEALIAARAAGYPIDAETAHWLNGLSDAFYGRLVKTKLVPQRECDQAKQPEACTLGDLLERYMRVIAGNRKPNTVRNLQQASKKLVEYFGADRSLESITAGHAFEWKEAMLKSLAEASVATHVAKAKQVFAYAKDLGLVQTDPFHGVKKGSQKNRERQYFVDRETIQRVIDACPNWQWRLVVALARFGGLRTPSELKGLVWADVDWAGSRILIRATKTEHLDGHATRTIPIFPELRPYLEAAFDAAEPGQTHVVPMVVKMNSDNLRTQLIRFSEKAGVTRWPKTFQNLRASRRTELEKEHPQHLANNWLGHSGRVAEDHYLMPTEEDYRRASAIPGQNPGQSAAATGFQKESGVTDRSQTPYFPGRNNGQVPSTGIEPVTSSSGG